MFRKSLVLSGLRISAIVSLFVVTMIAVLNLSGCGGSSSPVSVAVTASAATVDATDAVTLTAAVTNDKNSGGVTWSVNGGGTLSNQTTSGATYTAPAASSSALTVTVTATSVADTTKTGTATLTIPAAPAVTTGALAAATIGTAYSQALAASGGIAPYAWTITSGTLPTCLTMNAAGVISGTPTASCVGTTNLTFKVTDSGTATALSATSAALGLTINAAQAITFTGTMPATATTTVAYAGSAAASGGAGALTYTLNSGSLPTGLSLNAGTGALTGTPTAVGPFPFTIKAADAFGDSNTQAYTITVSYPALNITTGTTLPTGYAGAAYSQTLAATGGSGAGYTWTVTGGAASLAAANLSLSSGGVLSGTPAATSSPSFTVKVTDSASNTASATFNLTIAAGVSITTGTTLSGGFAGSAYSQTLAASGGTGSGYTWTVTGGAASLAAANLSLSSSGVLSGTPAATSSPSFTVKVTDSANNTASATFSLTIAAGVSITTGTTLPTGFSGVAYSQTLAATGGTGSGYTWTVTAGAASLAAANLSLSSGGVLSGTPSAASTPSFTVKVTDSANNTASATFSLTIAAGLTITSPATLPAGYVGSAYSQTLTAGGGSGSGYTWTVTGGAASLAAANLSLSSSGVLTGTPAATSSPSFTVKVTDSASNTASATLSLTISAGVSITTGATLATGYVGSAYSQTLAATGGSGTGYTWTVTGGAASLAAANLSLSSGGVLTGTPAATSSPSFTVKVTDSASNTASATFSLTISAGVSITTGTTLPAGYAGTAYSQTLAATGGSGSGYTWTVTGGAASLAAANLSLSSGGVLTGTPSSASTPSFTVKVTDSASNTASATFSLTIQPTLSITTGGTLPSGTVSTLYSQNLAAAGGSGTGYTWTVTAGASQLATLNLSLSGAGVLSGTPATNGSASFTAKVTDSSSHTATANLTVTIYAGLTVTTSSLPATNLGASYSQTLAAAGGTGTGYSWTATSSNLAAYGLSLSTAGVITGTPTQTGTASFTANVTDSASNTAFAPLSITVYSALSLPSSNPVSLPGTGTTGVAYSGTVGASGGSGSYTWLVTGLPSDSITASPSGGTLTVSGTPGSAATVTFTAKVTDTATGVSVGPFTYTIVVSNPTPVSLPTPNPVTLPSATVSQSYTGTITASGGVSPFSWTINGTTVPTNGTPLSLTNGLSATNTGGNTLTISGTPTTVGTVTLTNVKVTDSVASNATNTYTIAVNSAGSQVSGTITLNNNNCNGSNNVPVITVKLYTSPGGTLVQTVTTDNSTNGGTTGNGSYSFATVPNGNYTITPSITGASSVFYPATQSITVTNGAVTGKNFGASLGYTVSGTISYAGTKTGQVYVVLNSSCGSNNNRPGTSITAPGAFTINGVGPGTYTPYAWMDNLGNGAPNATNPAGTAGANVVVTAANATGAIDTLIDPTLGAPTAAPTLNAIVPNIQGVTISFNPIKSNGIEAVAGYTVQWSTSSSFTSTSSESFAATGNNGNVWILNNGLAGLSGSFVDGTTYYFRARGELAAGHGPWTVWGGGTPTGVTVNAPSGGNTVTGTVTFTGTATGPLYVGYYNQSTGAVYAQYIASPVSPQTFTTNVPSGTYFFFGIIDQNNDGMIDAGDITNTNEANDNTSVTISGNMSGQNLTLPSANSTAAVTTQYYSDLSAGGTSTGYSINFNVREGNALPVAVQLVSGPNVAGPIDIGACGDCGTPQFQYYVNVAPNVPNVSDAYVFHVTYLGNPTPAVVSSVVTGWNGTSTLVNASDLATGLSPSGSGGSATPTFTWTYPASASSYTYSFYICCATGSDIWDIPGQNSNTNGFTNTQIPGSPGIVWGTDPTDNTNTPSVGSLTNGTTYNWQIQVQDSNGNQAQTQVYYIP